MHGDEHPMRTTTHPESIPPSPARSIFYPLSSKCDSPAKAGWPTSGSSRTKPYRSSMMRARPADFAS
jgi:hypothetical protein